MADTTANPIMDAARVWHDAGFCVIPSHEDGSKRPFGQWKAYQTQRPDWPTLEGWLRTGKYTGIGLIMGRASGNTEMMEIEGPDLHEKLSAVVNLAAKWDANDLGMTDLLMRVYNGCSEESAGGGLHIFIRVTDGPVPGNTKLSMGDGKVITETRGEGGFVIVWPTPARTGHADGAVYMLLPDTSPDAVAEVTTEELELLHHLFAEAFGGLPAELVAAPSPARVSAPAPSQLHGLGPFDDYAAQVSWEELLQPAGWTFGTVEGDRQHVTRPGKDRKDGASGNIRDGCLYIHSTSVTSLPINQGLSKAQTYAWLHHDGDLPAASRALRAAGYGDPHHEIPELPPWLIDNPDVGLVPEEDIERQWVLQHLPVLDWPALWADETEEEWIVYPLLPARRLVALYSAPKVGKSLLLLELAAGVATGAEIMGNPAGPPRTVLYVDFENDPRADIRERLQNMGYEPEDISRLKVMSFPTMDALDGERGAQQLMAAVRVYGAELVVIDTVSRAISGDENENDTWLDFYRHTGLKLKQAEVALIRLDHSGKDETKGQRGGSAKSGDVDAVWRMSRASDDLYDLTCEANRLPIIERQLTIRRLEGPLRHEVVGNGRRAKRDELMQDLFNHKIPKDPDLPVREAKKLARELGVKFKDNSFTKAIWEDYCNQPDAFMAVRLEGA